MKTFRYINLFLILIFTILISNLGFAAPDVSIGYGAPGIYEGEWGGFSFDIINSEESSEGINKVEIELNGFSDGNVTGITDDSDFIDWVYNVVAIDEDSTLLIIEPNDGVQPIQPGGRIHVILDLEAANVNQEETFQQRVRTYGSITNEASENIARFTILNDENPPNAFLDMGEGFVNPDRDYWISLNIQDLESGFDDTQSILGRYSNTANLQNNGNVDGIFQLECTDKVCYSFFNFSEFPENKRYFNFRIANLEDKAGNVLDQGNDFVYHLYIDRDNPEIKQLNTFSYVGQELLNTMIFSFSLDDDSLDARGFDTGVFCNLFVDGDRVNGFTTSENRVTSDNQDLSYLPGRYVNDTAEIFWYVSCNDAAGHETISTNSSFILDTAPLDVTFDPGNGTQFREGDNINGYFMYRLGFDINGNLDTSGIDAANSFIYRYQNGELVENIQVWDYMNTNRISPSDEGGYIGYFNVGNTNNPNHWLPGEHRIVFSLIDRAGNLIEEEVFYYVDGDIPRITLGNNASLGDVVENELISVGFSRFNRSVFGKDENMMKVFAFSVNDKTDNELNCRLKTDGEINGVFNLMETPKNGERNVISPELYLDFPEEKIYSFNWDVECQDDAGNRGDSGNPRLIRIDAAKPKIDLSNSPEDKSLLNSRELVINYEVTDNTNNLVGCNLVVFDTTNNEFVGEVSMNFDDENLGNYEGEFKYNFPVRDGEYLWDVICNDAVGNYANNARRIIVNTPGPNADLRIENNRTQSELKNGLIYFEQDTDNLDIFWAFTDNDGLNESSATIQVGSEKGNEIYYKNESSVNGQTTIGLLNFNLTEGNKFYLQGYVAASDGDTPEDAYKFFLVQDTLAPIVDQNSLSPTNGQQFSSGTTSVNLSFSLNEPSYCSYVQNTAELDINSFNWENGILFSNEALSYHTTNITGSSGNSYLYYFRCSDEYENIGSVFNTSFSVASQFQDNGNTNNNGGGGGGRDDDIVNTPNVPANNPVVIPRTPVINPPETPVENPVTNENPTNENPIVDNTPSVGFLTQTGRIVRNVGTSKPAVAVYVVGLLGGLAYAGTYLFRKFW